jgi:hypothetical protein
MKKLPVFEKKPLNYNSLQIKNTNPLNIHEIEKNHSTTCLLATAEWLFVVNTKINISTKNNPP